MGVCFSSDTNLHTLRMRLTTTRRSDERFAASNRNKQSSLPSAAVKVITVEGKMHQYNKPIKAKEVVSDNPNCFLCSSETMSIGCRIPPVPDDEDLQPDQIYFLMRISRAQLLLTLPELCELAIKTSAVLGPDGVEVWSTTDSRFVDQ